MYIHVHVLQDEKTQIHTPVGMCLDNFVTTGMSRYLIRGFSVTHNIHALSQRMTDLHGTQHCHVKVATACTQ